MRDLSHFAMLFLAFMSLAPRSSAEVTRVKVIEQRPWLGGKAMGAAGAFELLRGTVYYEVDPSGADGKRISDIGLAPRNSRGKVEFSGPFLLLRPVDAGHGRGTTLIEVANRGTTQMNYSFFTGDGFELVGKTDPNFTTTQIFDNGYTMAWVGWQGDLGDGKFGLNVPAGTAKGRVRANFTSEDIKDGEVSLVRAGSVCAAGYGHNHAVLRSVVDFQQRGRAVARSSYSFAKRSKGKLTPDACTLHLKAPLKTKTMYELVYDAAPAPIIGLGLAAVRDFGEHLKGRGAASTLNEHPEEASRLIAFGYSQSGRFLRDYLYRGFNAGTGGQRVFDGMMISGAGAGRGSFDHRYAMTGEAGNSVLSILRPVDLYPFSDTPSPDIDGQGNASLLDTTLAQHVMPKLMYTLSSTEYWARAGSLLTVSPDGKRELPLDPSERMYYFPATVHAPGPVNDPDVRKAMAPFLANANYDAFDSWTALLDDLDAWIRDGTEPPPSDYPHLGSTLVPASQINFPRLKGVSVPSSPPPVWQLNFGPGYSTAGVISNDPPKLGQRYPLLVPLVDSDGNEVGGYRGVFVAVPLGTYTAWYNPENWLKPFGASATLHGGFLPFPKTKAEREASGDPRLSIEERYGNRAGYEAKINAALDKEIADRMLAAYDRTFMHDYMLQIWDQYAVDQKPKP